MTLHDLEAALDRLENVLNAEQIPEHVRREIDRFTTHVAAELMSLIGANERPAWFRSLHKPRVN